MVTEKTGKELVLTKEVYKEIFMEYYKPLSLFAKKVLAGQDEGGRLGSQRVFGHLGKANVVHGQTTFTGLPVSFGL